MFRTVLRVAALGLLVAALAVAGNWPAVADGALGLNGPTGEPLPWTVALVVGFGGAAFVVRALVKLCRRKA
jgi:hypothetical protein